MQEYGEASEQAEIIWDKYLRDDAPEWVNLPDAIITPLKQKYQDIREQAKLDFEKRTGESGENLRCPTCNELVLDSLHVPQRHDLDAAKENIANLVKTDTLFRFKAQAKGYISK